MEHHATAARDDALAGLTSFRVFLERRILHALHNFERARLLPLLFRNGLVGVSWHLETSWFATIEQRRTADGQACGNGLREGEVGVCCAARQFGAVAG